MTEAYNQQEVFWRQRSKQLWLREGDQNSKFFHASAKARHKANHITNMANSDGEVVGRDSGLQEMTVDYFHDLFKASKRNGGELLIVFQER